jgi:hypothetical protein
MGLGYHELCLVGWYWSRRNSISAVFYFSVSVGEWPLTVLQKQFFCYSSRFISNYSHGSSMVSVLGFTNSTNLVLWVNFNSPLLWDICNLYVSSVSLVFWWTGLLPDFAMLRDELLPLIKKSLFYLVWMER